jgi:hypothetical protein
VAGEHGLMGEVLGEHRLAVGAEEDDIGSLGEEVGAEQLLEAGAVDLARPAPVEVGQGLEVAEPGLLEAIAQGARSRGAVLQFLRAVTDYQGAGTIASGAAGLKPDLVLLQVRAGRVETISR